MSFAVSNPSLCAGMPPAPFTSRCRSFYFHITSARIPSVRPQYFTPRKSCYPPSAPRPFLQLFLFNRSAGTVGLCSSPTRGPRVSGSSLAALVRLAGFFEDPLSFWQLLAFSSQSPALRHNPSSSLFFLSPAAFCNFELFESARQPSVFVRVPLLLVHLVSGPPSLRNASEPFYISSRIFPLSFPFSFFLAFRRGAPLFFPRPFFQCDFFLLFGILLSGPELHCLGPSGGPPLRASSKTDSLTLARTVK